MKNNDYLAHYGVLGMKWGHRRAQKRGETYKYTSLDTKSYQRRADKLNRKANKARDKARDFRAEARNKNNKLSNRAEFQDKADRASNKAARLRVKAKRAQRNAVASQKYDDLKSDYAINKAKIGTTILGSLLTSPALRQGYQDMRASGMSKGQAIANSILYGNASGSYSRGSYIYDHS